MSPHWNRMGPYRPHRAPLAGRQDKVMTWAERQTQLTSVSLQRVC